MASGDGEEALSETVAAFVDERPDREQALDAVLDADADRETWTFDDVPLDSGTFGELVAAGIVEKVDGEYRVADRDAVRAVLDGETVSEDDGGFEFDLTLDLPHYFEPRALAGLAGALAFLFAMRITSYREVFRGDHVVSPGNDPYYYRYWMEQLLAESDGMADFAVTSELSDGALRRPLTHTLHWWFAELLGGDQWAADMVAAWLPVVGALALGVVLYLLAVVLTDDVRVGVASVVFLALAPIHATYSGLGFLEHRLHQYFWMGVVLLTISWLAVDLTVRLGDGSSREDAVRDHLSQPQTWIVAMVLGIALGLYVHTWGGSPILFVPLAAYVALRTVVDVREGVSPARANAPVVAAFVIGSVIAGGLHLRWGWHHTFVALTPSLVLGGTIAVLGFGEVWRRMRWPVAGLLGSQIGVAGVGIVGFRVLFSDEFSRLTAEAAELFFREGREGIVEAASLFSETHGFIFGPLAQLGAASYIAFVVLGWATWLAYRQYEPAWMLVVVFTWWFLALASIQVRFAGPLALLVAVFGAVGFVHVLSTIDLARPLAFLDSDGERSNDLRGSSITLPSGTKLAYLFGIFLLVGGLSFVFVPTLVDQTTYNDAEYEAMVAIAEHAEETEQEYPENFVFSQWGDNRMYNYFVNGEADGYGYAYNNYQDFLFDDDPDGWYDRFENRVGYVILTDIDGNVPENSTQAQLHEQLGSGDDDRSPLAHYRLLYVDDDTEVAAFEIVPGATIDRAVDPEETVTIAKEVDVGSTSFTYERTATADENGTASIGVPYPGEYTVNGEPVLVNETAVMEGEHVG